MKLAVRMCLLCLLLSAAGAWANVVGSTNAALFPDTIDWCAQSSFACDGGSYSTPQAWTSLNGNTGLVGLWQFGSDFQALQAGSSLFGSSFPDGMGVLYNGVSTLGNPQDYFVALFNTPQWGAGAYIQSYFYGPFLAGVALLDSSYNTIGAPVYFIGNSTDQLGDLLFVGATNSAKNVYGVAFIAFDQYDNVDFSIGTAGLATPEPASILLMAPSMLGLYGIVRRRRSRKSQEVL